MAFTTQDTASISASVTNHAALPPPASALNQTYAVDESTGTYPNVNKDGLYRSDGAVWKYLGDYLVRSTAAELQEHTQTETRSFSPSDISDIVSTFSGLDTDRILNDSSGDSISDNDGNLILEGE